MVIGWAYGEKRRNMTQDERQCIFEETLSGNRITRIRLDVFNPTPCPRPPGDKPKFKLVAKYIEGNYIVFVDKPINQQT